MRFSSLLCLSLALMPALAADRSGPATGTPSAIPAQQLLTSWLGLLRDYVPVLRAGVESLAAVDSADKAEAALPAIRAVQQGDNAIRTAARAMEAQRFYPDDFLWREDVRQAMQQLPVGRYHAERARLLRSGCYGHMGLFLALTGREGRFSPEQAAAPISEAERTTLAQMEEVNRFLAAVQTEADSRRAGEHLLPLVREISAALPAMNPAALCEAERLRQETDSHIARVQNNYLLESRLLEALLLQAGSYLADSLMTARGEQATLALVEHPFKIVSEWPSASQRCREYRAAHAEAAAAFYAANGMAGGDASTPDKAVRLPEGLHPAEQRALLRRFGREVLGESSVPFIGGPVRERRDGGTCLYAAGHAGRTGDNNYCHDKAILVPFYFLIP